MDLEVITQVTDKGTDDANIKGPQQELKESKESIRDDSV